MNTDLINQVFPEWDTMNVLRMRWSFPQALTVRQVI